MKNKALAIRLIKKDCKLQSEYIDCKGNTCAIGMLALKSGVSKRRLEDAGSCPINDQVGYRGIKEIAEDIRIKFGLSQEQQSEIQTINDEEDMPANRRAKIIAYLKTL